MIVYGLMYGPQASFPASIFRSISSGVLSLGLYCGGVFSCSSILNNLSMTGVSLLKSRYTIMSSSGFHDMYSLLSTTAIISPSIAFFNSSRYFCLST